MGLDSNIHVHVLHWITHCHLRVWCFVYVIDRQQLASIGSDSNEALKDEFSGRRILMAEVIGEK